MSVTALPSDAGAQVAAFGAGWSLGGKGLRAGIVLAVAFSAALNLLYLALPIYSMQVFNRVLPSASLSTLAALVALTSALLLASVLLDGARSALLVRLANRLDLAIYRPAVAATVQASPIGAEALRDAETLRSFGASSLSSALLDAPWCIAFLVAIFVIHPLLGWLAVLSLASCGITALISSLATNAARAEMSREHRRAMERLNAGWSSRHAMEAMGLGPTLLDHVCRHRRRFLWASGLVAERQAWIDAAGRGARSILLVLGLAAAAWLVLSEAIRPGALIAVSLLFGRVTTALERLAAGSQILVSVLEAWRRIQPSESDGPQVRASPLAIPRITGEVRLENVTFAVATQNRPVLNPISLLVSSGEVIVVVGNEGAGKSTFARLVAGALMPTSGVVRLDGSDIRNFDPRLLGPQIGFLPEDVELGVGSVASLIARSETPDAEEVLAAARLSGAHKMILRLPDGYQTIVGSGHHPLSAGGRQRIGLARALYRCPALVVLDEPTAHLDDGGETDIVGVVSKLKAYHSTVIVVSRHAGLWKVADRLLLIEEGQIQLEVNAERIQSFARLRVAGASENSVGASKGGVVMTDYSK